MFKRLSKQKIYKNSIDMKCKAQIVIFVLILLVLNVRAIIYYPFTCGWDTLLQIKDFFNGSAPMSYNWVEGYRTIEAFLNDHHPICTTFYYALFYFIGGKINNISLGMFFGTEILVILTAYGYYCMLKKQIEWKVPKAVTIISLLFLIFFPMTWSYPSTLIKDSLYSMIFIFYLLKYFDIFIEEKELQVSDFVKLIIFSCLLAVTKKTGVFLVVISNFLLILKPQVRTKLKSWLVSFILPAVLIFIVFQKILFPICNIYPGGKQEALNVCIQQVSRVIYVGNEPSESEDKIIKRVIDDDNIAAHYDFHISDGVKEHYNFDATSEDIKAFLILWFKWGLKYPKTYIKSIYGTAGVFFIPNGPIRLMENIPSYSLGLTNISKFSGVRQLYSSVISYIEEIPLIGILLRTAIYTFWIPFIIFLIVFVRNFKKKQFNNILVFVPILLSFGVLLVSPQPLIRYGLSIIYTLPILLGFLFKKE